MTIEIKVTTQAELDAALKDHVNDYDMVIKIDSPFGVWLKVECASGNRATVEADGNATVRADGNATVRADGNATVRADGNATVRAYGNATVEAYGNATVRADGNATVRADGNATVEADGNATVRADGNATVRADGNATVEADGNATVRADGNATVEADGNATVRAYGNATVRADGNATVEADGNATVRADGNATVRADGNATVRADGNATVEAGRFVAVHLFSATVKLQGGVLIDMTQVDLHDPETWCEWAGAERRGNNVVLYKAVDVDLYAGRNYTLTKYPLGKTVKAADWRDDNECGGGLHLSPHVHQAISYFPGAKRFLECEVALADLRPITDADVAKAKMPNVKVIREVDHLGRPIS